MGKKEQKRHPLSMLERLRWPVVFLAIFTVISAVFAFFEMREYYQRRENGLYLAANQVKLMDSSLSETMSRVYTLRMLVTTNGGDMDFFDRISAAFYEETAEDTGLCVKNFILAPGGIVEKIYPMEGNESLLGFDYMDESQAGNREAVEAYQENRLILTEPFSLRQGGNGVAARLPIYMDEEDGGQFWGLAAVTLDADYLMEKFNLDYLKEYGFNYCLWYEDDAGSRTVLKASMDEIADPVSSTMTAHNLVWNLDVEPEDGWVPLSELVIGFLVILAVSGMLTRLLATQAHIREMNAILEQIALRDNLTGCYSRHFVSVMLLRQDSRMWKEEDASYSMAVIDLDDFKRINDTFGHDVGDQALVAVADVLKGLCDELRGDCVVRYGGDEFVLLMNNVPRNVFETRLQDILEGVRGIRLAGLPDLRLTVSIGAVADNCKSTYHELFSRADRQIYLSKTGGKDQYHLETTQA